MRKFIVLFKFKIKLDTVLHCWRCKKKIEVGEMVLVVRPEGERDVRRGYIWDEACLNEAK